MLVSVARSELASVKLSKLQMIACAFLASHGGVCNQFNNYPILSIELKKIHNNLTGSSWQHAGSLVVVQIHRSLEGGDYPTCQRVIYKDRSYGCKDESFSVYLLLFTVCIPPQGLGFMALVKPTMSIKV